MKFLKAALSIVGFANIAAAGDAGKWGGYGGGSFIRPGIPAVKPVPQIPGLDPEFLALISKIPVLAAIFGSGSVLGPNSLVGLLGILGFNPDLTASSGGAYKAGGSSSGVTVYLTPAESAFILYLLNEAQNEQAIGGSQANQIQLGSLNITDANTYPGPVDRPPLTEGTPQCYLPFSHGSQAFTMGPTPVSYNFNQPISIHCEESTNWAFRFTVSANSDTHILVYGHDNPTTDTTAQEITITNSLLGSTIANGIQANPSTTTYAQVNRNIIVRYLDGELQVLVNGQVVAKKTVEDTFYNIAVANAVGSTVINNINEICLSAAYC
ncbi:hypothetical protein AX774_g6663 [Zancudomyces culisetae]|uniref:Uncharacterized protein n=1 Tax=Zancudomyces culisetae TaxID=1213189 RepID=A0A1R1PFV9_ZANCU|nr:hypothetical protein AX774_g6687 [Zancudomyces culisetae]OMH79910.1 hypothetical protein AX774_g6663 [Zancudomyces culisetae]|eukprot:OMH79890.1 hypothetical protein AX774_g6687 [Zancudomyces culisetae]